MKFSDSLFAVFSDMHFHSLLQLIFWDDLWGTVLHLEIFSLVIL